MDTGIHLLPMKKALVGVVVSRGNFRKKERFCQGIIFLYGIDGFSLDYKDDFDYSKKVIGLGKACLTGMVKPANSFSFKNAGELHEEARTPISLLSRIAREGSGVS